MDQYWPELEWDFRTRLGLRAMDWFDFSKGLSWLEFYRFKQRLGAMPGTAYHSALMRDPELAQVLADEERSRKRGPSKGPSPEGFDPLMHKLTDLEDRLIAVAASFGGGENIQWSPRPKFLFEELADRASRKKARKLVSQLLPYENIELIED